MVCLATKESAKPYVSFSIIFVVLGNQSKVTKNQFVKLACMYTYTSRLNGVISSFP